MKKKTLLLLTFISFFQTQFGSTPPLRPPQIHLTSLMGTGLTISFGPVLTHNTESKLAAETKVAVETRFNLHNNKSGISHINIPKNIAIKKAEDILADRLKSTAFQGLPPRLKKKISREIFAKKPKKSPTIYYDYRNLTYFVITSIRDPKMKSKRIPFSPGNKFTIYHHKDNDNEISVMYEPTAHEQAVLDKFIP